MKTRDLLQLACLAVVLFMLANTVQSAESLSVLLQKGIYAEETEGNLDAAIKIYEGITNEADANRSLVAQAQYRLGVCQMKKGKTDEAEAAFRKLLSQFSDHAETITRARERLAEMGKNVSPVVVRQISSGPEAAGDRISPDGRNLAFVDWNSGNLAVRDLTTGQTRKLTNQGSWESPVAFAETCAMSADGKVIAYSWYRQEEAPRRYSYGLKLVNVETSTIRDLIAQRTNYWVSPQDWSPDGKTIAVFADEGTGPSAKSTVSIVSVADGSVRDLAAAVGRYDTLRFSPDGRYLAYNLGLNPERVAATNDIYVIDVQSGVSKLVIKHTGKQKLLGWLPGKSEIIFMSDQRGSPDLWSITIENGQAKEPANLLAADVGSDLKPLGLTRGGALFYAKQTRDVRDFFVASVEVASGKVLSPPTEAGRKFGAFNLKSSLSPDGRYLAFGRLGICDLTTGELNDFTLSTNLSLASGLPRAVWSPDGHYFVSRGWTRLSPSDLRHTLLVFDRATDKMSVLATAEQDARTGFSGLEIQGGTLRYFLSVDLPDPKTGVKNAQAKHWQVWNDLATGQTRRQELTNFPEPGWVDSLQLSPDEKHLFYIRTVGTGPNFQDVIAACRDVSTGKEVEFFHATNRFAFIGQPAVERPVLIAFAEEIGHLRGVHTIMGIEITESSGKATALTEIDPGVLGKSDSLVVRGD